MIRPVIFNYNMPEISVNLFDKLVSDGFSKEEIILVDNGSDRFPAPDYSNFRLPHNVRFTGQAYMTLTYLLNFFNDQHFLLITTSGRLLSDVNYKDRFTQSINTTGGQYGFITSGLFGGLTDTNAPEQIFIPGETRLARVYKYQPIVMAVSRKLLELCQKYSAAYFNLNLRRGWGIDRELQFIADLSGINCYADQSIPVEWLTNSTHAAGRADESAQAYWKHAGKEMNDCFGTRYGSDWENLFQSAFRGEIKMNETGDIAESSEANYG